MHLLQKKLLSPLKLAIIGSLLLSFLSIAYAGDSNSNKKMMALSPNEIQFTQAFPTRPGVKIIKLLREHGHHNFFVIRLKFPANYAIKPHKHSLDEFATIISGELYFAECGHKLKKYPAGSFIYTPAHICHYGKTGPQGAVTQVVSIGQWEVIDPTNKN